MISCPAQIWRYLLSKTRIVDPAAHKHTPRLSTCIVHHRKVSGIKSGKSSNGPCCWKTHTHTRKFQPMLNGAVYLHLYCGRIFDIYNPSCYIWKPHQDDNIKKIKYKPCSPLKKIKPMAFIREAFWSRFQGLLLERSQGMPVWRRQVGWGIHVIILGCTAKMADCMWSISRR